MDEIQIDIRLIRRGTVWCAVALVHVPGRSEPIPLLACVDCAQVAQATGADGPTSSAKARTDARDRVLEGVVQAFGQSNKPVDAAQLAQMFGEFKQGMSLCAAALRGDPRAMLAVVDLHKRAEHDHDPLAQRQLAMLRECLEASQDGRCSFRVACAGLGQMYRPMNNPMQGGRRDDMASGRNLMPGARPDDMMSGRNLMPGARPDDMMSGRNPQQGARPDDLASGVNYAPGFASRRVPQGPWMSHGNNPSPGAASRHQLVN
jgi:hypothetical protein